MFSLAQLMMPEGWLQVIAFGFGVIIGSFLNVLIYRFHTGKSLAGHSHCLSCGVRLRWFELFPLLSYVALRARCRTCGCAVPARYFLVELLTGALFVLALTHSLDVVAVLGLWTILSILVVITVYDLYHFIIPDELTAVLAGAVFLFIGYEYWMTGLMFAELLSDAFAAVLGAGFLYLLWLVSKGQWIGFGDVKLALPLGFLVGSGLVFSFIVLSFWIGAAVSLMIIGWGHIRRGKASLRFGGQALTMKSAVPFAPFLIVSALVVFFSHFNVLTLFTFA